LIACAYPADYEQKEKYQAFVVVWELALISHRMSANTAKMSTYFFSLTSSALCVEGWRFVYFSKQKVEQSTNSNQCSESVTFWTDPDPWSRTLDLQIPLRLRILLFSSVTSLMQTKNKFSFLICIT
jgi:hypothetical protein